MGAALLACGGPQWACVAGAAIPNKTKPDDSMHLMKDETESGILLPRPGMLMRLKHDLIEAHKVAGRRDNISSVTLLNNFYGSGSYVQALASAILSTGGAHAPVTEIVHVLNNGAEYAESVFLGNGLPVPGWGNSFIKGQADDSITDIFLQVSKLKPELSTAIDDVTKLLHRKGKNVFPNIGCATAATSICLDIPASLAPHLFIECRLPVWFEIAQSKIQ